MNSLLAVSKALRDAATESRTTTVALSERAGVSRPTVRKALEGTEDFRVTTLLALAEQLGLELVLLPKAAAGGLHRQRWGEPPAVPSVVDAARSAFLRPGPSK